MHQTAKQRLKHQSGFEGTLRDPPLLNRKPNEIVGQEVSSGPDRYCAQVGDHSGLIKDSGQN